MPVDRNDAANLATLVLDYIKVQSQVQSLGSALLFDREPLQPMPVFMVQFRARRIPQGRPGWFDVRYEVVAEHELQAEAAARDLWAQEAPHQQLCEHRVTVRLTDATIH